MMTLKPHRIADRHFDGLAAGYGDRPALALLVEGQLSRRKLLLRAVVEELSELPGPHQVWDRFELAWGLLAEIEAQTPVVVTGPDGVLRNPYLGVWAMECLRDLIGTRGDPQTLERFAGRLSYFTAVVAVAAARAGREVELEVVVPERGLVLPMLGRLPPWFAETLDGVARLCVAAGEITVRHESQPATIVLDRTRWLRPLLDGGSTSPDGLGPEYRPIRLEDTDPFRDAFGYHVADRLAAEQAAQWCETFDAGWQLIAERHPGYLPGLAAGLFSITPLTQPASGGDASAICRHAFGAIATVLPPTAPRLAVLLIHEFQHLKLGALLDLVALLDDSDTRLYAVPGRGDPQPLAVLLDGAYAHLAVTDFWRQQRHDAESADQAKVAAKRFGHWRDQTAAAVDVMLGSPALTDVGRRFISGMAATIAPWLAERPTAA